MMKRCPICGNEYSDNLIHCPYCRMPNTTDYKNTPLPAYTKDKLAVRFKWADMGLDEYLGYCDWIWLKDGEYGKEFFTERMTPLKLLWTIIGGILRFIWAAITNVHFAMLYYALYLFTSIPFFWVIWAGSESSQQFNYLALFYCALLVIPSVLAATDTIIPWPIRLKNFIFHFGDWKDDRKYKKLQKEAWDRSLSYMLKVRAHCKELRAEVYEKMPFLDKGQFNKSDLKFLAEALEEHKDEDLTLSQLFRYARKKWKRPDLMLRERHAAKQLFDLIERKHLSDYLHPEQLDPGPIPEYKSFKVIQEEAPPEPRYETPDDDDLSWVYHEDYEGPLDI